MLRTVGKCTNRHLFSCGGLVHLHSLHVGEVNLKEMSEGSWKWHISAYSRIRKTYLQTCRKKVLTDI